MGCCIANKFEFPKLSRNEFGRLFLYSFIFSFNIVYSQYGMKLTSLSLNQVTRATTPLYQCLLEYLLVNKSHSGYNLLPLLPVILGVSLTSLGDLQVTFIGLFISISSVFISALKGVLSMKILQKDLKTKLQEYTFLMIVAPLAITWIGIFEFSLRQFNEGGFLWYIAPEVVSQTIQSITIGTNGIENVQIAELPIKYLAIGGCLAFLTNVASFGTVKRTSASSMGVLANVSVFYLFINFFNDYKNTTTLEQSFVLDCFFHCYVIFVCYFFDIKTLHAINIAY